MCMPDPIFYGMMETGEGLYGGQKCGDAVKSKEDFQRKREGNRFETSSNSERKRGD